MSIIEFEADGIRVDATLVGEGLESQPSLVRVRMARRRPRVFASVASATMLRYIGWRS